MINSQMCLETISCIILLDITSKNLLPDLWCVNWKAELLVNFQYPKGFNTLSYPLFTRLTCFNQNGGLIYLSSAFLRIVKATEILFSRGVIEQGIGINTDKNLNPKLELKVITCPLLRITVEEYIDMTKDIWQKIHSDGCSQIYTLH